MQILKDVPGYEGLYKVSDLGSVVSLDYRGNGKVQNLKAGTTNHGYKYVILVKDGVKKFHTVHLLVAKAFLNHTPSRKFVVDHINNVRTDNRLENLQVITTRQNVSKEKRGSSKYTGVSWNKQNKKWMASIMINRKNFYLGLYESEEEAHEAYLNKLRYVE